MAFSALFVNFLIFGAVTTIVGATLPQVIRAFGWNYLEAGLVIASLSAGYFSSTFTLGFVINRIGFQRLICGGLLLQVVGLLTFGLVPHLPVNIAVFFILGFGQGATELVTNYSVVQMEAPGQSRLMNLMHAAFTIGALTAPAAVGFLVAHDISWRAGYQSLAVITFLMMGVFWAGCLRGVKPSVDASTSIPELLLSLRNPLLLLLTFSLFLYVGAEIGISSWIAEYFVRVLRSTPAQGAYALSIFWGGILAGRLATSLLYRGTRQALLLLLLSAFSCLSLAGALFAKAPLLAAFLFFVTGLGYSAIYPIVMILVGQTATRNRGVALGTASTGGGIGMCLFPLFMSGIANRFDLEAGFGFYVALTVAMTFVAVIVWTLLRSASCGGFTTPESDRRV